MRGFADQSPTIGTPEPSRASWPINLARESDFRLGALLIKPSLREVQASRRRLIIEPRVMQVLVALARMDGQVVSRDELIESCWGGRIVGEDAINRCIGRLRRLAETVDDSFSIDTVARVGYRLHAPVAGGPEPELASASGWVARASMVLAALALALGARAALVRGAVAQPRSGSSPNRPALVRRAHP